MLKILKNIIFIISIIILFLNTALISKPQLNRDTLNLRTYFLEKDKALDNIIDQSLKILGKNDIKILEDVLIYFGRIAKNINKEKEFMIKLIDFLDRKYVHKMYKKLSLYERIIRIGNPLNINNNIILQAMFEKRLKVDVNDILASQYVSNFRDHDKAVKAIEYFDLVSYGVYLDKQDLEALNNILKMKGSMNFYIINREIYYVYRVKVVAGHGMYEERRVLKKIGIEKPIIDNVKWLHIKEINNRWFIIYSKDNKEYCSELINGKLNNIIELVDDIGTFVEFKTGICIQYKSDNKKYIAVTNEHGFNRVYNIESVKKIDNKLYIIYKDKKLVLAEIVGPAPSIIKKDADNMELPVKKYGDLWLRYEDTQKIYLGKIVNKRYVNIVSVIYDESRKDKYIKGTQLEKFIKFPEFICECQYIRYFEYGKSFLVRLEGDNRVPLIEYADSISFSSRQIINNEVYIQYKKDNKICYIKISGKHMKRIIEDVDSAQMIRLDKRVFFVCEKKGEKYLLEVLGMNTKVLLNKFDKIINIEKIGGQTYIFYKQEDKRYFSILIKQRVSDILVMKDEPKPEEEDEFGLKIWEAKIFLKKQINDYLYVACKDFKTHFLAKIKKDKRGLAPKIEYIIKLKQDESFQLYSNPSCIHVVDGCEYIVHRKSHYDVLSKIKDDKIVWTKGSNFVYMKKLKNGNTYIIFNNRGQNGYGVATIENEEIKKFKIKEGIHINRIFMFNNKVFFIYGYRNSERGSLYLAQFKGDKVVYLDMEEFLRIQEYGVFNNELYFVFAKCLFNNRPDFFVLGLFKVVGDKTEVVMTNATYITDFKLENNDICFLGIGYKDGTVKRMIENYYFGYDKPPLDSIMVRLSNNEMSKEVKVVKNNLVEIRRGYMPPKILGYYLKYDYKGHTYFKNIKISDIKYQAYPGRISGNDKVSYLGGFSACRAESWREVFITRRRPYNKIDTYYITDYITDEKGRDAIVRVTNKNKVKKIMNHKGRPPSIYINYKIISIKDTTDNSLCSISDGKKFELRFKGITKRSQGNKIISNQTCKLLFEQIELIKTVYDRITDNQKKDVYLSNLFNLGDYSELIKMNFSKDFIQYLLVNLLSDEIKEFGILLENTGYMGFFIRVFANTSRDDIRVAKEIRKILNSKDKIGSLKKYVLDINTVFEYIGNMSRDVIKYRVSEYLDDKKDFSMKSIIENWYVVFEPILKLDKRRQVINIAKKYFIGVQDKIKNSSWIKYNFFEIVKRTMSVLINYQNRDKREIFIDIDTISNIFYAL